jgi:hypothetical protein
MGLCRVSQVFIIALHGPRNHPLFFPTEYFFGQITGKLCSFDQSVSKKVKTANLIIIMSKIQALQNRLIKSNQ